MSIFRFSWFHSEDIIMDNNKIVKEIDKHCSEEANPAVVCDECDDENVLEELTTVKLSSSSRLDADLNVIHNKRLELDSIQRDLDDLMSRINTFIADSQEESPADDLSLDGMSLEEEEMLNVTEKQDGPPEKELKIDTCVTGESLVNKIYTSDGSKPPEINWDAVGPILQKHVNDLQRLHNLNQMTNSVVKRIRNITQINEALLGIEKTREKTDDA